MSELSQGGLQLVLDNKSELGISEPDTIRAVQAGKADLGVVPARAFHGLGVTSFDALIAPLAVDSMACTRKSSKVEYRR